MFYALGSFFQILNEIIITYQKKKKKKILEYDL